MVTAWTAARPGIACVLCGARNAQQAKENAVAGKIKLSAEEIATLGELVQA